MIRLCRIFTFLLDFSELVGVHSLFLSISPSPPHFSPRQPLHGISITTQYTFMSSAVLSEPHTNASENAYSSTGGLWHTEGVPRYLLPSSFFGAQ